MMSIQDRCALVRQAVAAESAHWRNPSPTTRSRLRHSLNALKRISSPSETERATLARLARIAARWQAR